MNAVGIDVSKGKSMVAALRPMGEVALMPQEFLHTEVGLEQMAYAIIVHWGKIPASSWRPSGATTSRSRRHCMSTAFMSASSIRYSSSRVGAAPFARSKPTRRTP